jgi:MFS family permease
VTSYSVITNVFNNDLMKYIGYIEIVVGVGLGMGPVIGGLVYGSLKFDGTMYFFGLINTFGLLCCIYLMPNELNILISEEEIE